jgi:hypothetical protein
MKTINQLAALLTATALLTTACRKNDSQQQPADTGNEMMTAFFKQHAPQYESFTINANTGGLITSSKGTKYFISPNSLVNANGNPVSGSVTVSVKELGKASEMILGDRPATTSNGGLLISFGEFNIAARQGNENLRLRNDSAVRVQAPVRPNGPAGGGQFPIDVPMWASDTSITVSSNGHNDDNQPVTVTQTVHTRKGVSWNQMPGNNATLGGGGYNFRIDSLFQWRNCDVLYNPGAIKTTVLGYFGNKFNTTTGNNYMGQEPSMLFFKVRNQNTIAKLYNLILQPTAGKEGLISYQQSFNIGEQGTFLAISAKDGKFYAEMRDVTISAPAPGKNYVPYTFNMQEVTQSQLLSLIQQMDTK